MAWADYNGDGQSDVFIVRGGENGTMSANSLNNKDELLVQDNLNFKDRTAGSGLIKNSCPARQVSWVDFDRDNLIDIYVVCGRDKPPRQLYSNQLYRQKTQEQFVDIAAKKKLDILEKRWADKTPVYTINLEFINKLFPSCQIIHIIRDGHDVVSSFRDRWGYKSAMKAVKIWSQYITSAQDFGKKVGPERYIEIRYEDLIYQTEITLRSLFKYLNEPWEPNVIQYDQFNHDLNEQQHKNFTQKRRQKGNEQSLIYSSRVGAGKQNLDLFLKTLNYFENAKLLKKLGYL